MVCYISGLPSVCGEPVAFPLVIKVSVSRQVDAETANSELLFCRDDCKKCGGGGIVTLFTSQGPCEACGGYGFIYLCTVERT